jgi:hypothetical protein
MESQSNSRYYHGDCACKKKKVPSRVAVECEYCIVDDPLRYANDRRGYVCNCVDVEIVHEICETCARDRDHMDELMHKLDELVYNIPYDIKNFVNCEDKLKEVSEISKEMRQLNRKLLTRVVETHKKENTDEKEEEEKEEEEKEPIKLCVNMDCERYPPDWDEEEDTEDTYEEDQWKKCCLCDGYFNDDGMGDILFVQEEPNNQEAGCSLCGKSEDVVQMKGTGQYLCGNACDEEESEEDEEEEESEEPSCNEDKKKCETCAININTDNIIELSIEVNGHNLKLCLCDNCFQDKADILRKEGWNHVDAYGDDLIEEEDEEEETLEEYLKERAIDRVSNGECLVISHDLYLSRLTSEQRVVEKENDRLWEIRLKEINIQHEKEAKEDEDDEEESEGIGCNDCYACVTGGSTPCIQILGIKNDKTNWEIPLRCNEMCKDNM